LAPLTLGKPKRARNAGVSGIEKLEQSTTLTRWPSLGVAPTCRPFSTVHWINRQSHRRLSF
jgi:hypothetical protein